MRNGKCFDRTYTTISRLGYKLLSARMITIRQCGGDTGFDTDEGGSTRRRGEMGEWGEDSVERRKERWRVKVCRDCDCRFVVHAIAPAHGHLRASDVNGWRRHDTKRTHYRCRRNPESKERRWGKIVFVNLLYNYSLKNGRSGYDDS